MDGESQQDVFPPCCNRGRPFQPLKFVLSILIGLLPLPAYRPHVLIFMNTSDLGHSESQDLKKKTTTQFLGVFSRETKITLFNSECAPLGERPGVLSTEL